MKKFLKRAALKALKRAFPGLLGKAADFILAKIGQKSGNPVVFEGDNVNVTVWKV